MDIFDIAMANALNKGGSGGGVKVIDLREAAYSMLIQRVVQSAVSASSATDLAWDDLVDGVSIEDFMSLFSTDSPIVVKIPMSATSASRYSNFTVTGDVYNSDSTIHHVSFSSKFPFGFEVETTIHITTAGVVDIITSSIGG